MKIIGPLFCIFMNNFKYGSYDSNMYGFLLGIQYDCMFHAQGMLDQFYLKDAMKYRSELAQTVLMPLSIGLWYVLYSFTSPTNHSDTGFLFYYPIYYKFTYQSLYTTGTWQWIYMLTWLMEATSNQKFNERLYDLIVGSSMWAYISHYFFIVLVSNYFVRVFSLTYAQAIFANMLLTEVGILLSYFLLEKIHQKFQNKREKRNQALKIQVRKNNK